MKIDVIHYPVKVLGPGTRSGLWVQGCNRNCPGCISGHSHDPRAGMEMNLDSIMEELLSYPARSITISGGEPFYQLKDLHALLLALRSGNFRDIMIYSGYTADCIKGKMSDIDVLCDVLITEPFILGMESDYIWKGSDNQKMHILSESENIIANYKSYREKKKDNCLQRVYKNNRNYLFGIPYQQKWKEFENELGKSLPRL